MAVQVWFELILIKIDKGVWWKNIFTIFTFKYFVLKNYSTKSEELGQNFQKLRTCIAPAPPLWTAIPNSATLPQIFSMVGWGVSVVALKTIYPQKKFSLVFGHFIWYFLCWAMAGSKPGMWSQSHSEPHILAGARDGATLTLWLLWLRRWKL